MHLLKSYVAVVLLITITLACSTVGPARATAWNDADFPYNDGLWPTLHHDAHNSDHMAAAIGSFTGLVDMEQIAWLLRPADHPAVVLTVEALGAYAEREMFFIATGKTAEPNLHAYDLATAAERWRAAAPTANDPGPGACAMSSMALLDETGRLFISDCKYLFAYAATAAPGADGVLPYLWRRPLPGLRQYDETDGLWHSAADPTQPNTRAKPFITLFFTRKVAGQAYIGGISTDGGIYLFHPDTGALFANAWLDPAAAAPAVDWTPDGPCQVADYVARDDPMYYDISPEAADGLTPFGIWTTGVVPQTDDPDADYFMDPCQLSGYFNANTAGGGGMVINTPAVALDPEDANISRIYVNGAQSPALAAVDATPAAEDAIVYRIDFDPTQIPTRRLKVMNHAPVATGDRFAFGGRMPNGENSLSSPTLSPNEKWVISADNQGRLYNFSAETGQLIWMETIGSLLGSPTVVQRIEADGLIYVHTFGDSRLWTFACEPASGAIVKQSSIDFRQHILRRYWRTDKPGYGRHFVNASGHAYERAAVGASIAVATNDKLVMAYTVGWHDPDRPAPFLIPSHSVLLVVDRLSLLADMPVAAMVDAGYIDTNGAMEQASLIAPGRDGLRALIAYGSQSTTFARFLDVNDKMPAAMKDLYVKPYGGVRIARPVFAQTPMLTAEPAAAQPAGATIRWLAAFPGSPVADYRFSVTRAGDAKRVIQDFSPARSVYWTPLQEGEYTVEVTAQDRATHAEIGRAQAAYAIVSPIPAGQTAWVGDTNHPLVALFSQETCPAGARLRVDFRPQDSDDQWLSTGYASCAANHGVNLYVAGLIGGQTYTLQPAMVMQGQTTFGNPLVYTPADPGLTFPAVSPLLPVQSDASEPIALMAGFPAPPAHPLPLATDLAGEPLWYYRHFQTESAVLTMPVAGGAFLTIVADDGLPGQRLREVDLAGNPVREVTIKRINDQLAAMGQDRAGAFDHEAARFPNGQTLVQVSVERLMPGIQPGADTILGAMIVALDRDWQVVWAWNAFDHMDTQRGAVLGELCRDTDNRTFPGCPPLFTATKAADWIHGNHIAPSPADGHLIYSMRNQDWVVKIDYADGAGSGQVLWKLGADGDFATASGHPDDWFSHQHGAAFLSDDQLIVFDNGNTRCADADADCHSRGQMLNIDFTGNLANLGLNADMNLYSMALGNGQRLSDGSFNFTAGLLTDGNTPLGRMIEVGPAGEPRFILEAEMNIYRSYRLRSLYSASWNGFSRCAALLDADLGLQAPIIDAGGVFVNAALAYDPAAGALYFRLVDAQALTDLTEFSACEAAYLTLDEHNAWRLFLPSIAFGLDHFWAEMALVMGDAGQAWFELVDAGTLVQLNGMQ